MLGSINGNNTATNETGTVYGNFSFGNIYDQLLNEDAMREMQGIVGTDLKIAGVLDNISDLDVMDVGTGRQALSMALLKAKSVEHFDISQEHVDRFNSLLRHRYSDLPIVSQQRDLCITAPPADRYDFVYLSGIVHHFSNTAIGLKNCAAAVRLGGTIWVYFYRSGTFKWLICYMIRQLMETNERELYYHASAQILGNGDVSNLGTSRVMDDFFAPYIHLYSPNEYLEFMCSLGFEISATSHCDPFSDINLDLAHHSGVIVFRRVEEKDIQSVDTARMLQPESANDQISSSLQNDPRVIEIISLFQDLKERLAVADNPVLRFATCMGLHKFSAPQYYEMTGVPKQAPDYVGVNRMLASALDHLN